MARRKRRTFTAEFKAEPVALAKRSGRSVAKVAEELDLNETSLRQWIRKAEEADLGIERLSEEEAAELRRLRRELKEVQAERDFLKKARPSSRARASKVCSDPCGEGQFQRENDVQGSGCLSKRLLRLGRP